MTVISWVNPMIIRCSGCREARLHMLLSRLHLSPGHANTSLVILMNPDGKRFLKLFVLTATVNLWEVAPRIDTYNVLWNLEAYLQGKEKTTYNHDLAWEQYVDKSWQAKSPMCQRLHTAVENHETYQMVRANQTDLSDFGGCFRMNKEPLS
jgi:hypothetical protein